VTGEGASDRTTSPQGSFGGIVSGAGKRSTLQPAASVDTAPTPSTMRAARRRWATGVSVVTTIDRSGPEPGFRGATVSAFTLLSLDPPLVLIALETESRVAQLVPEAGVFAVSILDRAHEFQSDRFSGYGPQADGRFTGLKFKLQTTGCPILGGAIAWFDCTVEHMFDAGDHSAIVGRAVAIGIGEDSDDPLINYEGSYRRIEGA
jgi:flavin reductase (DIM6/NTAB) family NADH-FMN oxidoreductase RutF